MTTFCTFMAAFLFAHFSWAINGRSTYQAKIYKPNGYPLEESSVNFRFTVLDNTGSCTLYVEDFSGVNMSGSAGLMSLSLGSGNRVYPVSATTYASVFDNDIPSFNCQNIGVYNPSATDNRKIVMQFQDSAGWQTVPAISINAVPYAMYATKSQNSQLLNNKADTAFVEYSTLASLSCAADQAIHFDGVGFSCLNVGLTSISSSTVTTALGYTPVDTTIFNSLSSQVSTSFTTVNNNYATLNSNYSTLSSSLASIVSSQWSTSGSTINYSSGNVGIGTTNPTAKLFVTHNSATVSDPADTLAHFVGGDGNYNRIAFDTFGAVANYTGRRANGTAASPSGLLAGDNILQISALGFAGTSYTTLSRAGIQFQAEENWTDSAQGANIKFLTTAPGATSTATRMTITASGSVGVGTTTPTTNLHVENSNANTLSTYVASSGVISIAGGGPVLRLSNTNSAVGSFVGIEFSSKNGNSRSYIAAEADDDTNRGNISFGARTGGSLNELMRIDGNTSGIGMGISTPTARLHLGQGTASNAPLKFTSGTLLSSPQSGTIEYDGASLYFTDGANTRRAIATNSGSGSFDNTNTITNSSGNITLAPNDSTGSVVVSATTASTNSQTGSLVVKGGMGVTGNLYSSGTIVTSSNIQGASITATAGVSTTVVQGLPQLILNPAGGNVGVYTTSPVVKFHVAGNALFQGDTTVPPANPTYAGTWMSFDNVSNVTRMMSVNPSNAHMSFWTKQSGQAPTEKVRITDTGYVGIGTTSPGYALDVSGTLAINDGVNKANFIVPNVQVNSGLRTMRFANATTNTNEGFQFYNSNSATSLMFIQQNGNVGVGTTAPQRKFQIDAGDASTTISENASSAILVNNNIAPTVGHSSNIQFGHQTQVAAQIGSIYSGSGGGGQGHFYIATRVGGNVNERVRVTDSGNVGIGTSTPTVALEVSGAIRSKATMAGNSSYVGYNSVGGLTYSLDHTGDSAYFRMFTSAASETVRIMTTGNSYFNGGNVGIGTSAPATKLQVQSANTTLSTQYIGAAAGNMFVGTTDNQAADVGGVVALGGYIDNGTTLRAFGAVAGRKELATASNPRGYLGFSVSDSNAYLTERMRINSDGNVGIGTTTPTARLEVSGSVRATGNIVSTKQVVAGFYTVATGATIDFDNGNVQALQDVGTDQIDLLNMLDGGSYTIIIEDETARMYTFNQCTSARYVPANANTVQGSRTIYNIVKTPTNCYISWTAGY